MLNKVAFLTTVFPMKRRYLVDFFDSLLSQSFCEFDIIVVNDGYKGFSCILDKYKELNIVELVYSNTIAKNREFGINFCKNKGYEALIFGDSDDYFSNNRVELSLDYLKKHDIVVNDVTLFNENGIYERCYMSNRINNKSLIRYNYIKNKNIFGLSNTAINLSILDEVIFDKEIVAVDWMLYKNLLKNNKTAIFINTAITYYRQHKNNVVGLKACKGKYYFWWEKQKEIYEN